MMLNLQDLYQELIIDHSRSPRHFGELPSPTHLAHGFNPLCGDELKIYLQIENNIIEAIQFTGVGCAISIASASLMAEHLQSKSLAQVYESFQLFHEMLTLSSTTDYAQLGKLMSFANVKQYPIRVKCATLAWQTLKAALEQSTEKVTTENDHE